nr:hypothetical transcript [Hymenolepis microstoma]
MQLKSHATLALMIPKINCSSITLGYFYICIPVIFQPIQQQDFVWLSYLAFILCEGLQQNTHFMDKSKSEYTADEDSKLRTLEPPPFES